MVLGPALTQIERPRLAGPFFVGQLAFPLGELSPYAAQNFPLVRGHANSVRLYSETAVRTRQGAVRIAQGHAILVGADADGESDIIA